MPLTNGRIILPQAVASAQALVVEEGKIAGITDIDSLGGEIERIDVGGRYIAPGLIDIHNHGALGHTFNDPTEQAFATITEENVRRRCDIFAGDDSHGIDCRSAGQSRVQPAMDARPSRCERSVICLASRPTGTCFPGLSPSSLILAIL